MTVPPPLPGNPEVEDPGLAAPEELPPPTLTVEPALSVAAIGPAGLATVIVEPRLLVVVTWPLTV